MKKLLSKLSEINYSLKENNVWLNEIIEGNHYKVFPIGKKSAIADCNKDRRKLLSEKQTLLDSLQIAINLEKADINTELKELNNHKIK